jgi:gluconokinase
VATDAVRDPGDGVGDGVGHLGANVEVHVVLMGVSGSGKTTLALELRRRLGWPYAEADDFHPQANIDRMAAGVPLTDEDRWPWLDAIRDWLTSQAVAGRSTVVTCSALRLVYRDVLRAAEGRVRFVHLTAAPEVIAPRLAQRGGHFMPASLLPSQLAALEPLRSDEDGVTIVVDAAPDVIADRTIEALGLARPPEPMPAV